MSSNQFFSSYRSVLRNGMQQTEQLHLCLFQLSVALSAFPLTPISSLVDWAALVWSLLSGWQRGEPANWCWPQDQGSRMVKQNDTRLSNELNQDCSKPMIDKTHFKQLLIWHFRIRLILACRLVKFWPVCFELHIFGTCNVHWQSIRIHLFTTVDLKQNWPTETH